MSFTLSNESGESGPVKWLIENRILQFNFNLLFGRGESGKSHLTSKLLGDWHNNPLMTGERKLKRILWLTEEEGLTGKVKPRLFQYGLTNDQIVTINYHTGDCPRPIIPLDHEKFVTLLKDNNINCVVIDPWTEVLHGDWSVFAPEQMRPYINGLNRVCFAARATIFGIGHIRKATGKHSSDDMLGCRQVMDSSRCVNRVDKTEELPPRHFFTVQKCNDADPTLPMQFGFGPKSNGFSQVVWKGEFEGTIGDIKSLSESEIELSKMESALIMLRESLHDGDKPCIPLYEEAKMNGVGDRTLDKAKSKLKVSSHRIVPLEGKPYSAWRLPEHLRSAKYIYIKGREMPQLTMEDLPEHTTPPLKTLAEVELVQSIIPPTETQVMEDYFGPMPDYEKDQLEDGTKPGETKKKKPAKKPAGKGSAPKKTPRSKSK